MSSLCFFLQILLLFIQANNNTNRLGYDLIIQDFAARSLSVAHVRAYIDHKIRFPGKWVSWNASRPELPK